MKKLVLQCLVVVIFITLVNGCKKESCEGYDQIVEISNVYLFGEDTLQYFENEPNKFFGISLSIFDDHTTKNGSRNCNKQDLAVQFKDEWDEKEISVKCDKELRSGSQTYRANSELINTSFCRLTFEKGFGNKLDKGRIDLIGIDGISISDNYTFTLRMKTEANKNFTSNHSVYIQR